MSNEQEIFLQEMLGMADLLRHRSFSCCVADQASDRLRQAHGMLQRAWEDLDKAQQVATSLAARCAAQSELLSQRAERVEGKA